LLFEIFFKEQIFCFVIPYRGWRAARDSQSDSVKAALASNPKLSSLPINQAVEAAEVIFLAAPFQANADVLAGLNLAGKILVDCTNPVGPGLSHGLQSRTSGSEEVQRLAFGSEVVKAFTIYGFENLQDNSYPGYGSLKPAMLLAGDNPTAKLTVAKIAGQLGWQPVDAGPLSSALHLEHMTLLWIKMGRAQGLGPNFVWAMLQR